MDRFYVVTNRERDKRWFYTNKVRRYLESKGKICVTQKTKSKDAEPVPIPADTECIIILGGDGTMLQTARECYMMQIPLIGINIGTLGYLADIDKSGIYPALDKLINNDFVIEHRMMLYGKVIKNGKIIVKDIAVNEVSIGREGHRNLVTLENCVDDIVLNRYRADGVIVSSPTGSTGYSLSAGGPIISPEAELFLLTPLSPQSMINRSIVLPASCEIKVKLLEDKDGKSACANAVFDGDTRVDIESGDEVIIKRSNKDMLIAKISDSTFLDVLYQKMNPINITEVFQ